MQSVPGDRYEYELNVLMWATRQGIPMREVSIHTVYEPGNPTSHFDVIRDSYRIYVQLFKFGLSSFGSFWVDYIALLTLRSLLIGLGLSQSLLVSSLVARIMSGAFNYSLNRTWVFHCRASVKKTAGIYILVASMLWCANFALLYVAHMVGQVPLWLAKPLVDLTLFVLSYNIQKRYVFPVYQD
jgi:putative flippase GtrA